jgi:hypothetical protein
VYRQPKAPLPGDIDRMTRHELIASILEVSKQSTFQFTPAWLRKQWTGRLRTLYRSMQPGQAGKALLASGAVQPAPDEIAGRELQKV